MLKIQKSDIRKIKTMYVKGCSLNKIAKKLNRTPTSIRGIVDRNNIKRSKQALSKICRKANNNANRWSKEDILLLKLYYVI